MSDTIRLLQPDDELEHAKLMSHAFGRGRVVSPRDADAAPGKHLAFTWGLFRDNRLLASAMVEPFAVCWPDAGNEPGHRILPMGGIGGVATWADSRGLGLVERLLVHSLQTMRDQGLVVSNLYPFAFSYYRKFGWEWVGEHTVAKVPLRELPRSKPDGWRVDRLDPKEAKAVLAPLWDDYARRHRCAFPSSHHKWHDHLGNKDNRVPFVFVAVSPDGIPAGYLIWRYEDKGRGSVPLLVSLSPTCDLVLLSLLRDLGMQCETARIKLGHGFPIKAYLCHWDLGIARKTEMQGRVVDVAAAMAKLTPCPVGDGNAVVRISDPHAPWNHGGWRFEASAGTIAAVRADDSLDPDLECPITAFSQLFYGTPSLDTLERAGVIKTKQGAGRRWLGELFPELPVVSWDGF